MSYYKLNCKKTLSYLRKTSFVIALSLTDEI